MVVSARLATLPYWEQCWFASDTTATKSVKLRLYLMDMPSGVAVKVCAVQPTTDTAASATSIDLNISSPLTCSQHYLSQQLSVDSGPEKDAGPWVDRPGVSFSWRVELTNRRRGCHSGSGLRDGERAELVRVGRPHVVHDAAAFRHVTFPPKSVI